MSDETIVESAGEAAGSSPPDAEPSSGFSRRSFLKAAALGTAAATLLNRNGLEFGPASALATPQGGCVDLSGNPCTANDVNIIGDIVVTNPCSCSSGTFTANIETHVQNNTNTGRYCVQLNLPPGSLGAGSPLQCVILTNKAGGGSTATPGLNTMTGQVTNFPCSQGLVTVPKVTIGWSTSNGSAGCTSPTSVPGGQCHQQPVQFVNFQATLSCGNGTTQNCTAPCTGLATLTACITADSSELPVRVSISGSDGSSYSGTVASVDSNFSGCLSFPATLTGNTSYTLTATIAQSAQLARGCTRTASKSLAFSTLSAPTLNVSVPTCAGGSTVLTASPSGLSDYTFQVDATNYDNGTNPVLSLSTLASGGHSAKVTVANSLACTNASPSSSFDLPTPVTTSLDLGSSTDCAGHVTFTATGSGGAGGFTFAWKVDSNPVLNHTTNTLAYGPATDGSAHTITVSAIDSSGCVSTNTPSNTVSECVSFTITPNT